MGEKQPLLALSQCPKQSQYTASRVVPCCERTIGSTYIPTKLRIEKRLRIGTGHLDETDARERAERCVSILCHGTILVHKLDAPAVVAFADHRNDAKSGHFWQTSRMPESHGKEDERRTEGSSEPESEAGASPQPATSSGGSQPREVGGPKGPEPTRFGDWERAGRCIDF